MRAVRNVTGGVTVVPVEERPGAGELLTMWAHRFPLQDATEAFRVAADRSSGALRVVIEP